MSLECCIMQASYCVLLLRNILYCHVEVALTSSHSSCTVFLEWSLHFLLTCDECSYVRFKSTCQMADHCWDCCILKRWCHSMSSCITIKQSLFTAVVYWHCFQLFTVTLYKYWLQLPITSRNLFLDVHVTSNFVFLDEIDQFLHDEFEYYTTTTTVKPKQPPTFSPAATASTGRPTPSESDDNLDDGADVTGDAVSANDIYNKYLHLSSAEYVNEHEYFLKAKNDLEKHHHEKVTKVSCCSVTENSPFLDMYSNYIYIYIHINIYTFIHIHTHTYIHMNTHTHCNWHSFTGNILVLIIIVIIIMMMMMMMMMMIIITCCDHPCCPQSTNYNFNRQLRSFLLCNTTQNLSTVSTCISSYCIPKNKDVGKMYVA